MEFLIQILTFSLSENTEPQLQNPFVSFTISFLFWAALLVVTYFSMYNIIWKTRSVIHIIQTNIVKKKVEQVPLYSSDGYYSSFEEFTLYLQKEKAPEFMKEDFKVITDSDTYSKNKVKDQIKVKVVEYQRKLRYFNKAFHYHKHEIALN